MGEYDQTGALQQEYIWLGDQPVAVANSAQALFHVLSDHLNTPRQIVNTSGVVRWQWDSTDPFGNSAPNPNPTGTAANFTYNLRFPGQYYDGETGLFYNYYRTYDPKTGRYTQSDPIGLGGGLNTFGYVGGNPLSHIDPNGLFFDEKGTYKAAQAMAEAVGVAVEATTVATVAGVALLVMPSSLGNSELPPAQNSNDDCCKALIEKIKDRIKELHRRYYQQCRNKRNEFVTHQIEYENKIRNLSKLVKEAEEKNCDIPPEAYQWLNTPCPEPGTNATDNPPPNYIK